MFNEAGRRTGWLRAGGKAKAFGHALGRKGRDAVHRHLVPSALWARINQPLHAPAIDRMGEATRQRFPAIWAEIEGLAEGLDLPLEQVFAWNCRGDLLASVPDGCTTVHLPGPEPIVAHNEDGLPFFAGHCFMVETAEPGFMAFCYPGSIPGHTFGLNRSGLVQTVNNLRLTGIDPDIPRMVLGRALLEAESIEAAIGLLKGAGTSGGFHFTLAQTGRDDILSIEAGGGSVSVVTVTAPSVHANHALHHRSAACQIVTASSRDRQERGAALVLTPDPDPLAILHDTGGDGLPILRQAPDDPDEENTLASAIFSVGQRSVRWTLYDRPGGEPVYAGINTGS